MSLSQRLLALLLLFLSHYPLLSIPSLSPNLFLYLHSHLSFPFFLFNTFFALPSTASLLQHLRVYAQLHFPSVLPNFAFLNCTNRAHVSLLTIRKLRSHNARIFLCHHAKRWEYISRELYRDRGSLFFSSLHKTRTLSRNTRVLTRVIPAAIDWSNN